MSELPKRHAISRAEFFLALADRCEPEQRDAFEAFLEASIIFARTAIHRLQAQFERHPEWRAWFASLKEDPAISFFREHRDFILKEGPPKVGQIINFNPIDRAAQLYYFEEPSVDAAATVRTHLRALSTTLAAAEARFRV